MIVRFRVAILCTLFLPTVATSRAAITVDPLSTGATDVTTGFSSTETPLTNPVVDPLNVSGLLQVGSTDEGRLLVDGGSQVSTHQTWAGIRDGSTGLLTLEGTGTHWSASSEIRIGGSKGAGTLEILNGATLSSEQGYIVASSGSGTGSGTVNVRGSGSRWEIDSSVLRLGSFSAFPALLTIEDGGVVDVNVSGSNSFSSSMQVSRAGAISLSGNQSSLHKQGDFSIELGEVWSDSLFVGQGASVNVDGSLIVTQHFSSTSNVRLAGGTLNVESLQIDPDRFVGNGTVNARGLVSDIDLEFGGNEGLQQQLSVPGKNIDINLDLTEPGSLGVGYFGSANLLVNESMQLLGLSRLVLGMHAGSAGTATVTGVGTKVQVNGPLQVGVDGVGMLEIGPGAAVEAAEVSAGPTSNIHFDNGNLDAGTLFTTTSDLTGVGRINTKGLVIDGDLAFSGPSEDFRQLRLNQLSGQNISINLDLTDLPEIGVGYRGEGNMLIEGGRLLNTGNSYLGYADGGIGTALVKGAGTNWQIEGDLQIGSTNSNSAAGSLVVNQGAQVGVMNTLNAHNGSTITVADAGSSLEALKLNLHHGSILEISSGAESTVFDSLDVIDDSAVRVRGAGSKLSIGDVYVGRSSFTIEDQAYVAMPFGYFDIDSDGTVELKNGILDMGHGQIRLYNPQSSQFLFSGGTLRNLDSFDGSLVQTGGVLEITSHSGGLSVDGSFTMTADATLKVNLAGFNPFGSGFLQVEGPDVQIGGSLKVLLGEGEGPFYEPQLGDVFSLFGDSDFRLTGQFDEVILPELPEGLIWNLVYGPGFPGDFRGTLKIVAGYSADFSGDGSVNAADLGEWESRFGDDLDGRDAINWLRQYGSGPQPLAVSQTIPEPSAVVLLFTALILPLRSRNAGKRERTPTGCCG